MDTTTHALLSVSFSRLGFFQRGGKILMFTLILSSCLPDIDLLFWLLGPDHFLRYHRWVTHSFIAAPFISLFVSIVIYLLSKFKNFSMIYLTSLAGIISHICFDILTSYGTQIFAPLSDKRYALDLIFVFDPILTAGGIAAILLIRRFSRQGFLIASGLLFYVIAYISLCFFMHESTIEMARAEMQRRNVKVEDLSVFPSLFWPLKWKAVVRSGSSYYLMEPASFTERSFLIRKVPGIRMDSIPQDLMGYEEVKAFFEFAKYPAVHSFEKDNARIIEFFDLRFSNYEGRNALVLEVRLDTDGVVHSIRIR